MHHRGGMANYPDRGQLGESTVADVADARAGVVAALARMERGERDSLDVLRESLCTYVSALKADGATREMAIDAVRDVISAPATLDGSFRLLAPAREALIELSMHWCAEEYGRS